MTYGRLVLVVDTDQRFLEETRVALAGHQMSSVSTLAEAVGALHGGRFDLVLLGPAFASDVAVDQASHLFVTDPTVKVALVADVVTNRLLKSALRAGLMDVIDAPVSASSLHPILVSLGSAPAAAPAVDVVVQQASATPEVTFYAEEAPPRQVAYEPQPVQAPVVHHQPQAQPQPTYVPPPVPPVVHQPVAPVAPVPQPVAPPTVATPPVPHQPAYVAPAPAPAPVAMPVAPAPTAPAVAPTPHRAEAVLDAVLPPPPSTPPPTAEAPAERPAPRRAQPGEGRVISVMAGKGGSGKTVVATNLAIALGLRSDPERVAIVDADLQFGDVALLLQLDPVRTLDDVVGNLDAMSDERLDAALLRHESGVRVLPAPVLPVRDGEITAKQVVEVVGRLRSMFDVVVVDTGPVFDDGLVTILEHSDEVVTVVDMDLPSVKNAKVALDRLRQIGYDVDRIRLVVNRVNSKARLDLVELERSLGLRVGGSVPSDRLVPQSVNEGIPVLALSPRSKVARAFHALAESFDPEAARDRLNAR